MSAMKIREDQDYETVFVVKVRAFGDASEREIGETSKFLGLCLHNAFGIDRVEIWHEGSRVLFDPLALDGEHEGHDQVIALQ